jgi:hypothetical protein
MLIYRCHFIIGGLLLSTAALAQPPVPKGPPPQGRPGAEQAGPDLPAPPLPGTLIEPQLAFIKTALKLTDAQLPAWDGVADVLREQAKRRDAEIAARRASEEKPSLSEDLIVRLQDRQRHIVEEGDDLSKLLAALKPLYAMLNAEQKETAAHLFPPGPMAFGPFPPPPPCQPFFRHESH